MRALIMFICLLCTIDAMPQYLFPYMETSDLSMRPVCKQEDGLPRAEFLDTLYWGDKTLLLSLSPLYKMPELDKSVFPDKLIGGGFADNLRVRSSEICYVGTWLLSGDSLFLQKIDPCFGIGDCMNVQDSAVYMRMLIEKRLEAYFNQPKSSKGFFIPTITGHYLAAGKKIGSDKYKEEYHFSIDMGKVKKCDMYYIQSKKMDDSETFYQYLSEHFDWNLIGDAPIKCTFEINIQENGKPERLKSWPIRKEPPLYAPFFSVKGVDEATQIKVCKNVADIIDTLPKGSYTPYFQSYGHDLSRNIAYYLYFDPTTKTIGLW